MPWVKTQWGTGEIHGRSVDFAFVSGGQHISGKGKLIVSENEEGFQLIQIEPLKSDPPLVKNENRLFLDQSMVNALQKASPTASDDFICFV